MLYIIKVNCVFSVFQANSPEDIPPVIATGYSYLISIFRNDLFFVSVVENEGTVWYDTVYRNLVNKHPQLNKCKCDYFNEVNLLELHLTFVTTVYT